jgi:hypothetical protein
MCPGIVSMNGRISGHNRPGCGKAKYRQGAAQCHPEGPPTPALWNGIAIAMASDGNGRVTAESTSVLVLFGSTQSPIRQLSISPKIDPFA